MIKNSRLESIYGVSTYPFGARSDYCEELRDSLDLVPIGAWHGNGRKVGWYSPFLLAAWDADAEEFQSVCRCMSGFSDAFYSQARALCSLLLPPSCVAAGIHQLALSAVKQISLCVLSTSLTPGDCRLHS